MKTQFRLLIAITLFLQWYTGTSQQLNVRRNDTTSLLLMVEPIGTNFSAFYGEQAGKKNTGCCNTLLGYQAGFKNTGGAENTFVGTGAGESNTMGTRNTYIGRWAGKSTLGNDNTFLGKEAGTGNVVGNNNTFIGRGAGGFNNGSGNIFLGNFAGQTEGGSNKLYIENSSSGPTSALIYGEFDNDYLRANARMEIYSNNVPEPGIKVIKNYSPGTFSDVAAIYGENTVDDYYGIGVAGIGAFEGVRGEAVGTGGGEYAGISGHANSFNSGNNYGVYGEASGGSLNYAGFFNGNLYVDAKLGVGSAPTHEIHIKQTANSSASGIKTEAFSNANNWVTNIDVADDYNFYFNGTLKGYIRDNDGVYVVNSDRRLKKDIESIPSVLENVRKLNPSRYYYVDANNTDQFKSNGFIAQDVQALFPEVVAEKNGYLGISYESMIPIAFRAIQEQQEIIQSQEARIAKLETMVYDLMHKSN